MSENTEISTIIRNRILGLVFILGTASLVFAQEKSDVTGKVVDKQNVAVPYASVTFSNKLNKLFSDAALTDEKGHYSIKLVPGDYDVTIEAIDYKKNTINKQIKAGNISDFVIEPEETITNTKTKDIQGVVITAQAVKPYKVELDKKTYDVNQDLISKGGNLQDVLQNVPSVSVDTDGTVSMRGNSNVKFLINGKPSALLGIDDGANALQSIPADQIDRIEVITNPSSKFEASGTAGILNIILKKNKKTGFNGSIIGTLGYLPQTNLNTNLSWRKGNFTWFLNGGGGYRETKNTNRNDILYKNVTIDGNETDIHNESINKNNTNNYNASTGLVYDISDKTSVNSSFTIRGFDGESSGDVNYNYYFLNAPNIYTYRVNSGNNNNFALQGDFGLDHKFNDKGQNLSLSLSLQRNRTNSNSDITETENDVFQLQNIINQKSVNKSLVGKADYELPINENSKLEAGYRLDINNNLYDNYVQESTDTNPDLEYLPKYTNFTNYKETFNAFYAQFKSKVGNLGYQIGLRDEVSNVNINYYNLSGEAPIDKTKNYNNLFPSVYLSYDLGKNNQILANYTKRIDRPRSFFMVPYPSYTDNQNIFEGNVDLNPSYVDSYELGYNITKKKFTINPTLYFKHTKDDNKMVVYRSDERTNLFYTKPINLGTNNTYGLDLNFTYDPFSWLKFLGNIDLFGYKTYGSYSYTAIDEDGNNVSRSLDFSGDGLSVRSRLTSTFKIDKTFNFQLQGFYRGPQKTESQDRKSMYAINFGASKTIWKGNGTLSFNIQDIFNTRAMKSVNYSASSERESYMQWQPRQFSVSLTYRFKQGEKIEQPKKKRENNYGGDDDQMPM